VEIAATNRNEVDRVCGLRHWPNGDLVVAAFTGVAAEKQSSPVLQNRHTEQFRGKEFKVSMMCIACLGLEPATENADFGWSFDREHKKSF